jgi:hypothetical protein
MDVAHLNQKQLAARWSISEATLERWRSEGIGPKFLKLCGRVLYRQVDIEAYEESCLATFDQDRDGLGQYRLRCSDSSVDIDKYRLFATCRYREPSGRARFPANRKSAVRKCGPIERFVKNQRPGIGP